MQSRRLVRVLRPEDEARLRALASALEGLPLPEGVQPNLGPDATGVGWVYSYALIDRSGQHDLAQLRSLQDRNNFV